MWEVQIYNTGLLHDIALWNKIKYLSTPTHIIYAENSNAFLDSTAKKISRLNPKIKMTKLDNLSHLFPLENPELVAEHILKGII